MIKIGPILLGWQRKKGSSDNPDQWDLDPSAGGAAEAELFSHPTSLTDPDIQRKALENRDFHNDILQKEKFAGRAYFFSFIWVAFLILIVIFQAFNIFNFELQVPEFVAVVTTTTASVFGFSFIVGRYLFGRKPPKGPNPEEP